MTDWRRIGIGIPAAALIGALGIYDLAAGAANVRAREASDEVGSWVTLPTGPRPDTLASLGSDIQQILPRVPDRAYAQELGGILAARQRTVEGMTAGKSLFSNALGTRPVSPYTWANFTHVSYELGQTGEEFEAALRHAVELGPWEPAVQTTVVNYGLAVREEVAPQTRAAIDRMVSNAMRRNPLETLQIAERRGRLEIACQKLVNPAADTIKRFTQCQ